MIGSIFRQFFRKRVLSQPAESGYLETYYNSNVWKKVRYHDIRTLKFVADLWNYQEIIYERKVNYVIETGTRHGGSALFFADTVISRNKDGFIISIDVSANERQIEFHDHIHFLIGDSSSEDIANQIMSLLPESRLPGSAFWILDSDHKMDHVYAELERLVPIMSPGDYLVVEDTCINGHPVRPDFGPGPWEAVRKYMHKYPNMLIPDKSREEKFLATFAPDGYYIRK